MDKRQLFECFDLNRNGCAGPKISSVRISDYLEPLQAIDVRTICHLHTNNQEMKKNMMINFLS